MSLLCISKDEFCHLLDLLLGIPIIYSLSLTDQCFVSKMGCSCVSVFLISNLLCYSIRELRLSLLSPYTIEDYIYPMYHRHNHV